METQITLVIKVMDDEIWGQGSLNISQWEGVELLRQVYAWKNVVAVRPFDAKDSVYPHAIAVIRAAGDLAVAEMLDRFGRSEVLLMEDAIYQQKMLRVGAGPLG